MFLENSYRNILFSARVSKETDGHNVKPQLAPLQKPLMLELQTVNILPPPASNRPNHRSDEDLVIYGMMFTFTLFFAHFL